MKRFLPRNATNWLTWRLLEKAALFTNTISAITGSRGSRRKDSAPDLHFEHPVCLAGANACPPEDCGGRGGYFEMTEIPADEAHSERESFSEWLG
ncbi:MAG TPA: hypothetical protein VIX17_15920 [Pyrinomonadaceae bacterium]